MISYIFIALFVQYDICKKETLQIDYLIKTYRETFTQFDNYRLNGGNMLRPKSLILYSRYEEFRDFAQVIINLVPIGLQHLGRVQNSETTPAFN